MIWDTVLFDLDGTLTDSGPGVLKSAQYALGRFGVAVEDWRTLRAFVGPPLFDSFSRYFPPAEAEAAVDLFRQSYLKDGLLDNEVYPGIPAMLRALRAAGRRLFVATSKPENQARTVLDHFGLTPLLDGICGAPAGSRADGTKAAIVRRTLHAANCCDLRRAVLVGDRKYDIAGGHEAGIAVLGVLYGYGDREELEAAGADAIAAAPEEITALILSHN